MAALFLTACAETAARQPIPAPLLEPVEVRCADGTTERALGECALRLRAGLETANGKISAIKELVTDDDR
ncbi:MAG: hypothetical protein CMH11_05230 [Maritimibacter sp.]|nr:hypothetical protein [Maritimibacter sp.]